MAKKCWVCCERVEDAVEMERIISEITDDDGRVVEHLSVYRCPSGNDCPPATMTISLSRAGTR